MKIKITKTVKDSKSFIHNIGTEVITTKDNDFIDSVQFPPVEVFGEWAVLGVTVEIKEEE